MEERIKQHINQEIENACEVVKAGGVILYPTDTIWGLGCDPTNEKAINKIFRIKRRVESKSLIILVKDISCIDNYVNEPTEISFDLIEKMEQTFNHCLSPCKKPFPVGLWPG